MLRLLKLRKSARRKLRNRSESDIRMELAVVQASINEQANTRLRNKAYFNEAGFKDSKRREAMLIEELRRRNIPAQYCVWTDPDRLRRSFS